MMGCRFPEHHKGGGAGFPWALAVLVAGGVIIATSGVFAEAMHDVMVMVLAVCATVTVVGVTALWVLARTDRVPRRRRAVSWTPPQRALPRAGYVPGRGPEPLRAVMVPRPEPPETAGEALEQAGGYLWHALMTLKTPAKTEIKQLGAGDTR
jgi:hypothetical protein